MSDGPLPVRGYHGTSLKAAERILEEGFTFSANEYDWLGDGSYFFQDAPQRAREWAIKMDPEHPAVVSATIDLDGCLDLLDVGWFSLLNDAHDEFVRRSRESGIALPIQRGGAHRMDRHVINYLAGVLEERGFRVRSVRAAFQEGMPAFPNSALFDKAHVQIAVRDPTSLSEIRIEPGGAA